MKKIILSLGIILLFACQTSKSNKREVQTFTGKAQGTTYMIKYIGEKDETMPIAVDSLLAAVDTSMSTYNEHSTITALNRGDSAEVDDLFIAVYQLSQKIQKETHGAFDPTFAPIIAAWGFDYSDPQAVDSAMVDSLLALCGFHLFELKGNVLYKKNRGAQLNFNAVAKGYSTDLIAMLLEKQFDVTDYYVELGGEMVIKGLNQDHEVWKIGIDKPLGENLGHELYSVVSLTDKALVTSGNYRNFVEINGEKYSHTINPKTGFPVSHNLLSATIVAKDAGSADAVATACMAMGLEKSKDFLKEYAHKYEGLLIYADEDGKLKTYYTPGLEGKIKEIN